MPTDLPERRVYADSRIGAFVVPLDGTEFARLALVAAQELAERLGADVHLLSTVEREWDVAGRREELAAIGRSLSTASVSVVVDRDPAGVIHETVKRLGRAIACLANHGRGRSVTLRTSVASDVIARGGDPVMLAGPWVGRPKGVWWSDAPISLSQFRGGGVVACLNGTATSGSLVAVALQWALALEEPMIALTVAEPIPPLLEESRIVRPSAPAMWMPSWSRSWRWPGEPGSKSWGCRSTTRSGRRKASTTIWRNPRQPCSSSAPTTEVVTLRWRWAVSLRPLSVVARHLCWSSPRSTGSRFQPEAGDG